MEQSLYKANAKIIIVGATNEVLTRKQNKPSSFAYAQLISSKA
jgi:hypothetical protein